MEPALLEFIDLDGRSRSVTIDQSPFKIGRSHTNHLALPSAEVSREHAEIQWNGERFVLHDHKSRAGTYVNDDQIEDRILEPGDRIRVGPTIELTFGTGEPSKTSRTNSTTTAITDLRRTATLLEGLTALGSARVVDHVLELVLDSAIAITGAERGFVILGEAAADLEFKTGRNRKKVTLTIEQFQTSLKIPEEVFRTGETRLVEDLMDADTASDHEGTIARGIRNVLCAPLRVIRFFETDEATEADRHIGVLYLDSRERQTFRSSAIQSALETLAHEAAGAIENARLYKETQEKARLEQDLRTANAFQHALLPAAAARALGFFEAAAKMVACRMIGGDFYEYVRLDGAVGFTLGDVAGKGAPAGLLGARIQEIFLAKAPDLIEPEATIAAINTTLLGKSLESRFVTMVYGILSPDGRLRYCNAGHNFPILVGRDRVRRLDTGGLIVGLFEEAEFEVETIQLEPDDLLMIFSDGISEATNADGEEFGDDRIMEAMQETDVRTPAAVLERVFDRLREFTVDEPQGDDMTGLVLRYCGLDPSASS